MEKLIIATERYPYGGEKSFLLPELRRLCTRYDITIISHAEDESTPIDQELPKEIQIIRIPRPCITWKDKVKAIFSYLLGKDGRLELKEILTGKGQKKEQIYQSLSFYAQTLVDQRALRKTQILKGGQNIIYYSFWYSYFCYSAIREAGKNNKVRFITRAHGVDLYQERVPGGRQPFRHQMEKKLHRIIFACQYGETYYRMRIAGSKDIEKELRVCRLGVEPTDYRMPLGNRKVYEVLSCSNVIPLKRIELIIDGLSEIDDFEIRWSHIGDGEKLCEMQNYAEKQLGKKNNLSFQFLGRMDNKEVHRYYREHQVDLFITTSSTEGGCPVSIQEAMAYGIPVIGTDVGGITEMIDGNGILLPATPTGREVAGAMHGIMELSDEQLEKIKEKSYRIWNEKFNAVKNSRMLIEELK